MIRTAVIPAAGLGTRFLPYTKTMPKEMLPLMNKPALHVLVENLYKAGIEEAVIVISESKRMIAEYFRPDEPYEERLNERNAEACRAYRRHFEGLPRLKFVEQREPLGLADALLTAAEEVGSRPFLAVLGDVVMANGIEHLRKLLSLHSRTGQACIGLYRSEPERVSSVGIAELAEGREADGREAVLIRRILEKPQPHETVSRLAVAGCYAFDPSVFELLREQPPDEGNPARERDLSFALNRLASRGELAGLIHDDPVYDIGTPACWHRLNAAIYSEQLRW